MRQPLREDVGRGLILVAVELQEVGFDAASMTAVADRAGVSRRTLFNYFPHKADLLFHGWDEFMQQFRDELNSGAVFVGHDRPRSLEHPGLASRAAPGPAA